MNTKPEKKLRWLIALLVVASAMLAIPQAASADDDDPPERVARLSYIQGSVSFQPAGEQDWVQAFTNRPVTTGDRIWADQGSRAELHIGAATIRLNDSTGFSFLNLDDRTVQIELTEGTVDIRVRRLDRDEIFEVDTPNQAFSILRPGRYRLQASQDGNSTYVIVRSGEGEATGAGQTYTISSGQSGTFTGTDQLSADIYDASDRDDFDNWGDSRDRRYDESQSARYVSPDVVGYEDLDEYGSWSSDPEYGNVWMPTRVNSEWAPYRDGHWAWISPWGWTWVDDEPWGYAPFHYGRWISVRGRWGWIPGPREVRPVYAPALVVFIGGGPQFGGGGGFGANVGWFPLGPREVYVPSYNVSRRYVERVNVSNTTVNTTTITNIYNTQITNNNVTNTRITYVNRTVRGGVTAVPQSTFASAQPVARAVVVVNQQQIAAAPVNRRAAVAPTRNSVLGPSASAGNRVARPPAAIVQRPVVAKAPAPPPPVSFEKQQRALASHPGQPLARHEVETLRPANVATERPQVKQAPPGKPATPNRTRPTGQPSVANPRQPANTPPSNAPANRQANETNAPVQKPQPTRNDRPPSAQQQADQTRQQQQQPDKTRQQQTGQQQQPDRTREQQTGQQQQPDATRQQQTGQQQQQDRTREQQADQTRQRQADQQQADQTRQRQADQQQGDQTRQRQADQQQADRARQRQADQQQADQPRQRQADQQQADQTRQRQADQQQADKARQRQADQQQADQTRQRQADQQQADKARQRQTDQQQADQPRQRQADQQQADRARQRQTDQQRADRPPSAQSGERQKNQPSEAQPKKSQTKAERDREEQKKREEKPPPPQ